MRIENKVKGTLESMVCKSQAGCSCGLRMEGRQTCGRETRVGEGETDRELVLWSGRGVAWRSEKWVSGVS